MQDTQTQTQFWLVRFFGKCLRFQPVWGIKLATLIYNPLSLFMTHKFLLPFFFLGAGINHWVVGWRSAAPSVTDSASLLLLSSESHRLRLNLCHLLWCFRILFPPGMILPSHCRLFTGLRNPLVRGSPIAVFLGGSCRLRACYLCRCCSLPRA